MEKKIKILLEISFNKNYSMLKLDLINFKIKIYFIQIAKKIKGGKGNKGWKKIDRRGREPEK